MSRSRNKAKFYGYTTATSEKKDKQIANRKFRRIIKQKINPEDNILPVMRELSNVWSFDKDGKRYVSELKNKDLRK